MPELKRNILRTSRCGKKFTQRISCGAMSPFHKHGNWERNRPFEPTWNAMMNRCYNEKRHNYKNYGGRGISVCEEWKALSGFVDWALSSGWEKGLQLDRINNDGDYCPKNCRWVTPKENARNKRTNIFITINGIKKCVSEWSSESGINPSTLYTMIKTKGIHYAAFRIQQRIS